jgi:hypothetical protein
MNREQNSAHQSSTFVEQALARINELKVLANDLTATLGLPEDYRYAVLSGLAPTLLEDYYESRQQEDAPLSSSSEEDRQMKKNGEEDLHL